MKLPRKSCRNTTKERTAGRVYEVSLLGSLTGDSGWFTLEKIDE